MVQKKALVLALILLCAVVVFVCVNNYSFSASYLGISEYYDGRKCVVTSTHDDLVANGTGWHLLFQMLSEKNLYHTAGIATLNADWAFIQHWLDKGYLEAGSHSRTHSYVPYADVEAEVCGSKRDIIENLFLPDWFRNGERQYVYSWIEPHGQSDASIRNFLGECYYLADRTTSKYLGSVFAEWDDVNGLFGRAGCTLEFLRYQTLEELNSKFDEVYDVGGIYHFVTHPCTHPSIIDLSEGERIDLHTDYISNRRDVWYVPYGVLYLYRFATVSSGIEVEQQSNRVFKITLNGTLHKNYGFSYPLTFIFNVSKPQGVYFKHSIRENWNSMNEKTERDFFNGVVAYRYEEDLVYVSVKFGTTDTIYLKFMEV